MDVKDDKTAFILELLDNFKYVKSEPLTPYKAVVLSGIKNSVEEMKLIKSGKLKATSAKDLLNEL